MLNLERIQLMTKLASYEAGEGEVDLRISRYYRSDYLGLALIKNFFIVSIAYAAIVGILLGYQAEYLLENVHKMELIPVGVWAVIGYVVIIVFYSVVTYIYHSVKHARAKKSVRKYYAQLAKLSKLYGKEERKSGLKQAGGRLKG